MNKGILRILILLLVTGTAYGQAVTISAASGGLAGSPQVGGSTNIAILGVQLAKAGGGGNTVTAITFPMSTTPVGKFTNARLYESADNTFSGVGSETLVTTGTISATDIAFSGSPLTDFDGANGVDDEFFFLVVDVDAAVTGATLAVQPSLASSGVTVSTSTVGGSTITGTSYSFSTLTTTIANLTSGVAPSPLGAGASNLAILGFSLTSNGTQTATVVNVQLSSNPASVLGSYSLVRSTDADFSTGGDNTTIAGLTFTPTATQVGITGLNESITTSATNYFLVVNIAAGVTGATPAMQPSLAAANVTVGTGITTGSATGTNYSFAGPVTTIANLSTGLAASPLVAGATGQAVFGFSLTSTAAETATAVNVQVSSTPIGKWGSYSLVKSTDNSFATTGDNTTVGGLTFTPSATEVVISGLSQSLSTTSSHYFLVVTVDAAVNAGTTAIQPSLANANVTVTNGTVTGSASGTNYSFAPGTTIAVLTTGVAASPLVGGTPNQAVFGFSLTSSGTQTATVVNVQVSSTPVGKWGSYSLVKSTDASFTTTGDNTAVGGATITPSPTQIAITGLSENLTTTASHYFLVVTVDPAVAGATVAIQPSITATNVTVSSGGVTGSATGTNYSFLALTATFAEITAGTAPVIPGTLLSAGSTLQVLAGFSVFSNGTQTISVIDFSTGSTDPTFADEYLYRSTTTGSVGSQIASDGSPDGNFGGLSESIGSTLVYYYLVVDVSSGVTPATTAVTVNPTQADITITGSKGSLSINRTFTFGTSQNSDITLTATATTLIPYRTRQASTINNTDLNLSTRLATYQLRDGGGASDPDDKGTNLTSLTISLPSPNYIRQIALFDDDTNTEIPGTEQTVDNPATTSVTFTPSAPITTTDGGIRNLMVRATFLASVVDNYQIVLSITGATANTSGSGFSAVGTWASTTTAPGNNLIDVVATKLVFSPTLPANVNVATNFATTVRAFDGLNNQDVDFTGQIDLTKSGPGTLTSFGGTTLSPNLVGGQFSWTDLRLSLSGAYTITASDDAHGDALGGDATGNITVNSPASTITPGTTPAIFYGIAFQPLSNIVITETDPAGISGANGTYTFSIALPSGFVFNQAITSGAAVGGGADLSAPSGYTYPSANIVQFSVNLNGTANTNTITMAGLQVGHPHPGTVSPPATGTVNITRSGGSLNISGVAAGAVLGSVSASQASPPASVSFIVEALSGGVAVAPGTVSFNINSAPVNLTGSEGITAATNVFSGSGVTFVSGRYRFTPNSLSSGNYPITYTHTNGAGSQFVSIKNFTVYTSGINGLNPAYCSNDPNATGLSVDQAFIDQRTTAAGLIPATGWSFDYFVYYDLSNFVRITTPNNTTFDPDLPAYGPVINAFGGQIPIGFAICNPGAGVPCGVNGNFFVFNTYQWVTVNAAPIPSLTIADPDAEFCVDDAPVTLTGTPPNSDNVLDDFFDDGSAALIVSSSVGTPRVWSFNPAVAGPGTVNITYTYKNPATGCSGTSSPIAVQVFGRPSTLTGANIVSAGGTSPETCALTPLGTFVASPALTSPNEYRWYSNSALTGTPVTGNVFTPPTDPNTAATTNFYVTQVINGCESNRQSASGTQALELSVIVKAIPAAPVPNFTDASRQYCVGTTVNNLNYGVPGADIRWYLAGSPAVINLVDENNPTAADISTLGITNTAAAVFSHEVTNTVAGCTSARTPITTTIKGLPSLAITADQDPLRICTSGALVSFRGSDGGVAVTTGTWTVTGANASNVPTGSLISAGGQAFLTPTNLVPDPTNYTLRFDHTNSAGCSNFTTTPFRVFPKITPIVQPLDSCDQIFSRLRNISVVQTGPSTSFSVETNSTNIASTAWNFSDGLNLAPGSGAIPPNTNGGNTVNTYLFPHHKFANLGSKTITVTMTTTDGCVYTGQEQLTINPKPKINFRWEDPCRTTNSATEFFAFEQTLPVAIPIATYSWNFRVNNSLNVAGVSGTGTSTPTVNYSNDGTDIVELTARTAAGCVDVVQKPVFIVPTFSAITETNAYDQNFESGAGSWITGGTNSTWLTGLPGVADSSRSGSSGRIWKTGLNNSAPLFPNNVTGKANESSWVLSPCFDFSSANRPVFSLEHWSRASVGLDGAVLQYNENGRIEDDNSWVVVGDVGAGINWYNATGIANSPGNQATGDRGWTGPIDWRKGIFAIDNLIGKSNITFRVAYATNQGRNPGFAFDNVFIGERSRVVLVEGFTNSSFTGNPPNIPNAANFNRLFRNFNRAELVKVMYHTAFPGADPVNALNEPVHNSRAALYGLVQPSVYMVDGSATAKPDSLSLIKAFDNRVLTPSAVKLTANISKVGNEVKINIRVTNSSTTFTLPLAGVRVFTVVMEKQITDAALLGASGSSQFVYVAKDVLPSPSGLLIPSNLAPGGFIDLPEVTWSTRNLVTPGFGSIGIFVQRTEGNSKDVLQAVLYETGRPIGFTLPEPDLVTSLEDLLPEDVLAYPNPANEQLTVELPAKFDQPIRLRMVDQLGRVLEAGNIPTGETKQTIDTSNLAAGMYLLQLEGIQGTPVRKKVIIVH
ncbi:MAG: T9SS type A sorting domain-containing protein [Cyclobacteriaceae bacterium]|nr:T9SS type A sorting domain-containing protein [Cyclobacteriaceae bacterium]